MRLASMRRGFTAAPQCYETSSAAVAEEVDMDGMASRRNTGEDGDACGAIMGMPSKQIGQTLSSWVDSSCSRFKLLMADGAACRAFRRALKA
jgi:hypothetical protein